MAEGYSESYPRDRRNPRLKVRGLEPTVAHNVSSGRWFSAVGDMLYHRSEMVDLMPTTDAVFLSTEHADGTDPSAHPCHSCNPWLKLKFGNAGISSIASQRTRAQRALRNIASSSSMRVQYNVPHNP